MTVLADDSHLGLVFGVAARKGVPRELVGLAR